MVRAEIDDLRVKHASVLKETKRLREGKDAEVDMVTSYSFIKEFSSIVTEV